MGKNDKHEIDEYKQKTNCSDLVDCSVELSTFSDHIIDDSGDEEVYEFSINSILQDDLLEQILVYLPIASMVRAGLVCKKWREITTSKRFLLNVSQTVPQKPWYFMPIDDYVQSWYAYDPILQKWQRIDFLDMMESFRICDSSDGLVCYRKRNEIHVCNPITRETKELPLLTYFGHPLLTNISVNQRSHNYIVSVLTFQRVAGSREELSFHVYDSASMSWSASQMEVLKGWISGHKSVICNGVMYFVIHTSRDPCQLGLLAYNCSSDSSSHGELLNRFIPLPCSDICGLMNFKGKLIIVAAIGRSGNEELNFGFSIWLLKGKDWQEISRITHACFCNSDELFRCSGAGDLIYISAYFEPRLVVFDMNLKQWKDCQKCHMGVGDLFNGLCFQPRLDISP
ncbi:unnamed protein product [Rhodiola kirilowii]